MENAGEEREIPDLPEGINQSGLRNHNERLVLTMLLRNGDLAGAELARRTGLSAQTVSNITRHLEHHGLLKKGEPVRGKVGKPLTPIALDPDGALAFGVRIGRRRMDVVLLDIAGTIRGTRETSYDYPTPARVFGFLEESTNALASELEPKVRARLSGIGVAAPFELWKWLDLVGAPPEAMAGWRDLSFKEEISKFSGLPVLVANDATLACSAEHVYGIGKGYSDFAYFFVGSFIGGGVVLNGQLQTGRTGNAGAFGTIPVGGAAAPRTQLIEQASIFVLEARLREVGLDRKIWQPDEPWSGFERILEAWIDDTARHLAIASVAVASVFDFEAILLDGGFPEHVRDRLVAATNRHIADVDTRGIEAPPVVAGSIGPAAGAIGAAHQPILAKYLLGGAAMT